MLENIKKTFTPAPDIILEAQKGKQTTYNTFLLMLLAVVMFLIASVAQVILMIPYAIVKVAALIATTGTADYASLDITGDEAMIVDLLVRVAPIIVLALYVKYAEKRSLRSMGFVKQHAVTDYLLGIVIAFAMFSACVGICVATGAMHYDSFVLGGRYLPLALLFVGFVVQGMSEEVICRGFMMTSIGGKKGALVGMLFNSLIFGALHLGNNNVSVLAIINIVLFGCFMSIVMLKLNSIWMVCAIHSVWNFVQGNFYGIAVSGMNAGTSVFRFTSDKSMSLLNGGGFGIEGGLATTIVLTVCILIALCLKSRTADTQALPAAEQSI